MSTRNCCWVFLAAALCAAQTPKEVRAVAKAGPSSIPQLAQFLKNPDTSVRFEAVKQLVDIGTAASIAPLIQATRDNDDSIQIRATDGLVNFYLPGYVPTGLGSSLKRAGASVKSRFVDRNDQVIDPYIVVRADVIAALGSVVRGGSSMDSRANAARAVGILRGRAALPDLYLALRSKDTDVLYESIVAIQKIRDASAGPHVQFLLRDLTEKVQLAAVETTGLLGNRAALPDLRQVLATTTKAKVRRAALTAIAQMPEASDRGLFSQYLNDKDDALRAAAAEGFGRLANPADEPMLKTAYTAETKRNPQVSLAYALVADGDTSLTEESPLRFLVQNLNSGLYRGYSEPLLTELAQREGIRLQLYGAMENGTKEEKIYLAQILSRTGDRETEPHLEKLSRDPDAQIAAEGLRALRNLRARL